MKRSWSKTNTFAELFNGGVIMGVLYNMCKTRLQDTRCNSKLCP